MYVSKESSLQCWAAPSTLLSHPSHFDAQVTLSEKVRLSYLKSDEMGDPREFLEESILIVSKTTRITGG